MLAAVLQELQRLRGLVGWPVREWTVCPAQCGELLARVREGVGIGEALDSVRAAVWNDLRSDPKEGPLAAKLHSGFYADLTRIFRNGDGAAKFGRRAQVARWITEWKDAGRPEPRGARQASGPLVPDKVDGITLTEEERAIWAKDRRAYGTIDLADRAVRWHRQDRKEQDRDARRATS